jgi:transposase-like protein
MKTTKIQNRSTKNDEVIAALPLACSDEKAAVEFMEQQRWGAHPACPQCGDMNVYQMMDSKEPTNRQANYRWRCRGCKAQYSVRTGTVYEESRIPLKHWCFAFWRASTSKKGVSALEIHRQTGLSYKSSLFLLHRIRYAMADMPAMQMGGSGKIVEADETYFGTETGKPKKQRGRRGGAAHNAMNKIVALVERGGGVRSFHVADVRSENLKAVLMAQIDKESHVMTDSSPRYNLVKREKPFANYDQINHSKGEYVRGEVTTNHVEGYFNILKRGLHGIYHNVSSHHLHRYLSEFDFRYTNRHLDDGERTTLAIRKANGKRLMYKEPVKKAH